MGLSFFDRLTTATRFVFSGYDAIANTRARRTRGFEAIRSEEVTLHQADRDRLTSTCLQFKRNSPIVRSISRLRKADVVGVGIAPQPQTGDPDVDAKLAELWEEYSASTVDVTESMTCSDVQKELVDGTLFYGDVGLLLAPDGKVQVISGDQIGQEGFVSHSEDSLFQLGVELSPAGAPLAYHIGRRVNGALRNTRRIAAQHFLLYFKRIRPNQVRGVAELAPCINALQDLDEYESIEMLSAKVAASLSAVIKKNGSSQFEYMARSDAASQDEVGRLQKFEPGNFHYLEPGEDIATISASGRPNVEGIEFCLYHVRKVGAALGIPCEFILQTIGGASFSASQAVVLQYQQTIEDEQRGLIQLLRRWYRWRVNLWVLSGEVTLSAKSKAPFNARWQRPAFRWINRAAQVQSDLKYIQLGAMSLDDVASQFGYTAAQVMERKAQNILEAQRLAAKYGFADWRELFNQYQTFANMDFLDLASSDGKPLPSNREKSSDTE